MSDQPKIVIHPTYAPTIRPIEQTHLKGWTLLARGQYAPYPKRPDLPMSTYYRFGVVSFPEPLSKEDCERSGVFPCSYAGP